MKTSVWVITAVVALIVAGVFFAGCSDDNAQTGDISSQPSATVASTPSGALYGEGDIVKNPKSTLNTGLIIIGYDAGTDMYERAIVYPYNDGSWGYRMDSKTSKMSRASLEKAYTEKVATVSVSSVAIGAPTTVTTVATTTKATTVATATETTASTTAPKIDDMDPYIGTAGTTVKITDLKGRNFVSGATVVLTKSGATSIDATDVSVSSATKITCKIVLPLSTTAGQWNVVVTNPDKQSDTYANLFTVYANTSATATSTAATTTTSAVKVTIYSLSPPAQSFGSQSSDGYIIGIFGTNLGSGDKVTLTQGSTILTSTEFSYVTSSESRAKFNIPPGAAIGMYTVTVLKGDTTLGSLTNGFEIKP